MLKILVKKQLAEIFRSYTYNAKKNKARSKGATAALIVTFVLVMVGLLGGMFTFLSLALCGPMAEAGMDWLYFTLMTLLAAFMGVFGSVFNTYSSLYLAKDNDLLLSMPIPVRTVMTARIVSVYLMGLMYSSVVYLPAMIVYWIVAGVTAPVVLGGLLLLALLSVFVLTLSCVLGWIIAKISQKLKNKSFITVLISLVFIGAYYFFYAKAQSLIQDLVTNAVYYGETIRDAAYPLYMLGSVAVGDGVAMAIVSAVVLAVFALNFNALFTEYDMSATFASSYGTSYAMVIQAMCAEEGLYGYNVNASGRRCASTVFIMLVSGVILYLVYGVGARDLGERLEARERRRRRVAKLTGLFKKEPAAVAAEAEEAAVAAAVPDEPGEKL